MSVFIKKPLLKKSFWQRIWKKQIPENLVIEVNNLLAGKPVLEVSMEEVRKIYKSYDAVTLARSERRFLGYYHQYLQKCLEDKRLTDQEIGELAHLKKLLGLPDRVVKQTHSAVAGRLFGNEFDLRVADGMITGEEQQFLNELSNRLLLSKDRMEEIKSVQTRKHVEDKLKEIMDDERITPEEEGAYNRLLKNLGYKSELADHTRRSYERYKLYWRLENESLPIVKAGIKLMEGEESCFITEADWYETMRSTRKPDFNYLGEGLNMSSREPWRQGYIEEVEDINESWELSDRGTLILTNRRLVFIGDKGERTVGLDVIYNYVPYLDGIRLEEDRGSSIIELSEHADVMAILLQRLLREVQAQPEEDRGE